VLTAALLEARKGVSTASTQVAACAATDRKNNITNASEALFDNFLNINNVLQYQFVM
jgi:hypothetical protein